MTVALLPVPHVETLLDEWRADSTTVDGLTEWWRVLQWTTSDNTNLASTLMTYYSKDHALLQRWRRETLPYL